MLAPIRSTASRWEPLLPGATRLRATPDRSSWSRNSPGTISDARTSHIRCAQAVRRFTPSTIISSVVCSRTGPGKSREFGCSEALCMDSALEQEIVSILNEANDLTIATIRKDGYPQATTVSYVNDGLTIYFGYAAQSQKAENIGHSAKVSLTVNLPYASWDEIRGLSVGGKAARVTDPKEMDRVGRLMLRKFPQIARYALADMEQLAVFRIISEIISVIDYRKGFGHTDLVKVAA